MSTEVKNRRKVYGSSSAFLWGRVVFTDSKAGCLRNILLQANDVREGDIPEKYKEMGAVNEARYEQYLKDMGIQYQREFKVEHSIIPDSNVTFSGRVDFIRELPGYKEVEELKSTDSKTKRRNVIKNGAWVPENLAQAVSYMISLECITGRLVYTYFERDEGGKLMMEDERAFEILIEPSGRISVDGSPTQFSVNDQLNHRLAARAVIDTGNVWDRPYNWDSAFKSPCKYCPFNKACDKYDEGNMSSTEFIDEAKKLITTKEQK
jgi:hypothetical protein